MLTNFFKSYYGARHYASHYGLWLSVDPLASKYPSHSPYNYTLNNPVRLIDPDGREVDEAATGFKEAQNQAKKQPAFKKIFEEWKNNPNILVKFNNTQGQDKKEGGTISMDPEKNEKGQSVYNVDFDMSLVNELGTSPIFEEAFHLKDAMEGSEMAFMPNGQVDGLDLTDEARAKEWVSDNIKGIKNSYTTENGNTRLTHMGQVRASMTNKSLINDLKYGLMKDETPTIDPFSNTKIGGTSPIIPYSPMGLYWARWIL